jgi:hypothetical protein
MGEKQISTRLLITHTLSTLPPFLLSPQHFPAILCTLRSELHPIPPRIAAYISGLSLFPPSSPTSYTDTPSFEHVENCMRLLDSFLLGSWASPHKEDDEEIDAMRKLNNDREDGLSDELVALCNASELLIQSQDTDIGEYLSSLTSVVRRLRNF